MWFKLLIMGKCCSIGNSACMDWNWCCI